MAPTGNSNQRDLCQQLTVFLIKPDVKVPEGLFRDWSQLKHQEVVVDATKIGDLYAKPSVVRPARWIQFFDGAIDVNALNLKTASAAAVLCIERRGRTFAVAFGQGWRLLSPSSFEENFGLRTALNASDVEGGIRAIDRRKFDAISRLSREQANQEVSLSAFGFEPEHELLRALTGRPIDPELGKRLLGRDALAAAVSLGLKDLPVLLERYLEESESTEYQHRCPGFESIQEVRTKDERFVLSIKSSA